MGFFDLPAGLLAWIDRSLLFWLPPLGGLLVWAVLGAALTMGLYLLVSPQARIVRVKEEAVAARKRLAAAEGELNEALPLMKAALRLSLRHTGIVLWPAVISSLPLLFLLSWLSADYGYHPARPGETVELTARPAPITAGASGDSLGRATLRVTWPEAGERVALRAEDGRAVAELPFAAAVPVVAKRQWWNALFGNPNGYLPAEGVVEEIEIGLTDRHFLSFGPNWMRTWEAPFFLALILASLAIRFAFRIQ